ncbi:hypothetical protein SmJEL517_g04269 [Synchytrium microbalum]|uniref:protein-serine/threonine phosphatase n=1 Tax=Synchytrium microbalum TaxID=1806994 RepID=A0A507BSK7_9FUNG|nr:uncharacterized protein SmJEL517_g04269 [Synchytrium microbalum]TPX32590.1 hypothetical protein SmJEL517_g04269 [Synchytrium microbalum]
MASVSADALKNEGNELIAKRSFNAAIDKYNQAIELNASVPAYYSNRAFAYIKVELYGAAIQDANKAIEIDPTFVKAYYRRAVGNMAMGKFKEAVKDFQAVCKVAPRDADAKLKLKECQAELTRRNFEKAIAVEDSKKSAVELLGDVDSIIVDPASPEPHLPAEGITLDFVMAMMEHMKAQKKLHRKYVYKIMLAAKAVLEASSTIVDVPIPTNGSVTICGDIHGQYYDLMNIFALNGLPSPTNAYIFNGDFVDRGSFSVECILTLLAFKALYPDSFFMSRGNHETDDMNKVYGFEGEVKAKYSDVMMKLFSEIFNAVPLGNLVGGKILVVHGGLFSRDGVTLDEIRQIDRFKQPGSEGLMCELLWSDPQPQPGRSPSKRGVGIQFGPDVSKAFCDLNGLNCVVRSHEVRQEGYAVEHDGKCITIFSAPNYVDVSGNKGAYIRVTPDFNMKYNQFEAVPHPNVKAMQYAQQFMSNMM